MDDVDPLRGARRAVVLDGVCSKLMDTLTGGVFLAGLGVLLGAGTFTLGVLASLPSLAQVIQIPTVKLLLHVRDRRRVVVAAASAARVFLLLIAVVLLLWPERLGPRTLVLLVACMALLAVVAGAAWNWWVRDLIPRAELGRFFAHRLQVTTLAAAGALVVAGFVLDRFVEMERTTDGYAILFGLGALAGFVGVGFLAATPHPDPAPAGPARGALALVTAVYREPKNRPLLVASGLVACTLTIALPFTAVFLLRSIGYSYLVITILTLVSQLAYVESLRGWGMLSDRFGNRPVLQISVGLLVAALVGWGLAWTDKGADLFAALAGLHFLTGFAVAGIDLAAANVLLKTAPPDDVPAYMAAQTFTRAAVAGVATIAAGGAWSLMGTQDLVVLRPFADAVWAIRGFHVLALVAAAIGVLAVVALRRVHEEGGAPVHDVAMAMRREVHTISSVAGIRAFVHVVSYAVEALAPPTEGRRRRRRRGPDRPAPGTP